MIRRLFGETKEEQLKYLGWRTAVSILTIIISIIVAIFGAEDVAGGILITVIFVIWGLPAIKVGLGFLTSTIAISNNIVIHVLLFMAAFILAYILGIAIALLGILRFAYLFIVELINRKTA